MQNRTVTTIMLVIVVVVSGIAVAATVAYYRNKGTIQQTTLEVGVEEADLTTESYTFISLSLRNLSREDGEKKIEGIVATWEKEHPDRTFLSLELRQVPSTNLVVGIAIYSKPKEECSCPCPE